MLDSATFVLVSAVACTVEYFWTRRRGFNMGDEGYLWYGALQTLAGRIPILHFRAYDPGRYWWVALNMRCFGARLDALRLALMLAKMLALVAASGVLALGAVPLATQLACGVLLFLWMRPRHKLVDQAILMMSVLSVSAFLAFPGPGTAIVLGLTVGLAFLVGLNHGLYQTVAAMMALLFTGAGISSALDSFVVFVVSTVVGAAPLWSLAIRRPGFASAYWRRKVLPILRRGHSNLPLPVPWPWRAGAENSAIRLGQIGQGVLFLSLPAYCGSIIVVRFLRPELVPPPLLACVLLGLPYLHHTYSRPDLSHLAQTICPLILAAALVPATDSAWFAMTVLMILTIMMTGLPGWRNTFSIGSTLQLAELDGRQVAVSAGNARVIGTMQALKRKFGWSREALLAVPNLAGVYAALGLQTPVYDTFPVYPGTERSQREMLAQLAGSEVRAVLVNDAPIDGRQELRFSESHPLVWAWIQKNSRPQKDTGLPNGFSLWVIR